MRLTSEGCATSLLLGRDQVMKTCHAGESYYRGPSRRLRFGCHVVRISPDASRRT